jgi:GTPase SAR1 family protein
MNPSLISSKFGSVLIIGKTGSGKTTLVRRILKRYWRDDSTKEVYTLNVKSNEYKLTNNNLIKDITFEQLNSVPKKSIIIVEDVISMTPFQAKALREAINYNAHHKRQKIYVISHHLYKTNIFQLIPYFNYVIFTASQSNLPLIKIVFQYFNIAKDQYKLASDFVLNNTLPFAYFIFGSENQHFVKADSVKALLNNIFKNYNSSGTEKTIDELMTRFNSFVSDSNPLKQDASTVFSILVNALPSLTNVNMTDLTLKCQTTKGSNLHISLIDYVMSLVTKKGSVSKHNVFLHGYFKKLCKIPKMFIVNKKYERCFVFFSIY